jgi:K+-sensing histidine kinase KdpD
MTILVAVPRTHSRDRVFDVGVRLANALGEDLCVVHLVEGDAQVDTASQMREEIRARVLEENVVATVEVEAVEPSLGRTATQFGTELLELAADREPTHIVVGHSSQRSVADVARGTTAFTVAEEATVPVTIVPDETTN